MAIGPIRCPLDSLPRVPLRTTEPPTISCSPRVRTACPRAPQDRSPPHTRARFEKLEQQRVRRKGLGQVRLKACGPASGLVAGKTAGRDGHRVGRAHAGAQLGQELESPNHPASRGRRSGPECVKAPGGRGPPYACPPWPPHGPDVRGRVLASLRCRDGPRPKGRSSRPRFPCVGFAARSARTGASGGGLAPLLPKGS
jgi:hypothetical protein